MPSPEKFERKHLLKQYWYSCIGCGERWVELHERSNDRGRYPAVTYCTQCSESAKRVKQREREESSGSFSFYSWWDDRDTNFERDEF